jgi:hypothetical protein
MIFLNEFPHKASLCQGLGFPHKRDWGHHNFKSY